MVHICIKNPIQIYYLPAAALFSLHSKQKNGCTYQPKRNQAVILGNFLMEILKPAERALTFFGLKLGVLINQKGIKL